MKRVLVGAPCFKTIVDSEARRTGSQRNGSRCMALLWGLCLVIVVGCDHTPVRTRAGRIITDSASTINNRAESRNPGIAQTPQQPEWRWRVRVPPRLALGLASGDSAQEFGNVLGAVRLRSGAIAVGDAARRQIRIFDEHGRFLRASGRRGEGPGEFLRMDWMGRCGEDTLFVHDVAMGKMIVLDPEGQYVRDTRIRAYRRGIRPYGFACDARGEFAVIGRPEADEPVPEGPHRPLSGVSVSDHRGGVISTIGKFPGEDRYRYPRSDMPHPFGAVLSVAIHQGRVYVGLGSAFEVGVFHANGELDTLLRWGGDPIPMTEEILVAAAEADLDKVRGVVVGDAFENRRRSWYRMTLPQTLPVYDRLVADVTGNLWIRQRVDGVGNTIWIVFSNKHEYLGEVMGLPSRFDITDVGDDYVLGFLRGEFRAAADEVLLFDLTRSP